MKKIGIYQRFDDLPRSYHGLSADAWETSDIFQTLPWFCNFATTALDPSMALRIYGVESEEGARNAPSLIMPMCAQTAKQNPLAARKLAALSNFYTPLFGPIINNPCVELAQDLQALIHTIAHERPQWDVIDFHPMEANAPVISALINALRSNRMAVQRYFCFGNWYLDVRGRTFDEYCTTLPTKLRNTLTRKSRQLQKTNRLRIRDFSGLDDVESGIADYEKVYSASWKSAETFPAFIPSLIRMCAQHGRLRLGVAYIDDTPAAAQFWIAHNGVASIYKLAYDERFIAFSVGTILTGHMMRHAIDVDRVREIDYLSGDDAYKQDWMSGRRERHGVIAFNLRTLRGVLSACKHIGGRGLKKIFRLNRPR
jgi:hypothetical protein